jgi:tRNA pseudouridine55 synthase
MKLNGWVLLDKPLGISSNHALVKVKRLFRAVDPNIKIGFVGTLDPLATGILIMGLGEATKLIPYVLEDKKTYTFHIKWGESTTTDDAEGEVLETSDVRPSLSQVHDILNRFEGEILQIPPRYSAIKIEGKRAYALARQNQDFKIKERFVHVYAWNDIEVLSENEMKVTVRVSKGTYIRSLARDIALALGTVGHVSFLRRVKSGQVQETDLISLDNLVTMSHDDALKYVLPLKTLLDDIPAFVLDEGLEARFCQGQRLKLSDNLDDIPCVWVKGTQNDLGLGFIKSHVLHPLKVFNQN